MHLAKTQLYLPRHKHMLLPLLQLPRPFADVVQASSLDTVPLQQPSDDGAGLNNRAQTNTHNYHVYHQKPGFRHDAEQ